MSTPPLRWGPCFSHTSWNRLEKEAGKNTNPLHSSLICLSKAGAYPSGTYFRDKLCPPTHYVGKDLWEKHSSLFNHSVGEREKKSCVTLTSGRVFVVDASTLKKESVIEPQKGFGPVRVVRFNHDGQLIVTGHDTGTIEVQSRINPRLFSSRPSVCLSVCLSFSLSVLTFVCFSFYLSFLLSVFTSVCLFFCLSFLLSVPPTCLSFVLCLSFCLSFLLSVLPSVCPSFCLSFLQSVLPPACPYFCLS